MEQEAQYSFDIEETKDGSRITYRKGKFGFGLGCVAVPITASISGGLCVAVFGEDFGSGFSVFLFIAITVLLSRLFTSLVNKSRKDETFEVTNEYIKVNNKSYALKHLNSVYVRDSKGNAVQQGYSTTVIVGGRGMMGAAAVGAAMTAQGARAYSEILGGVLAKVNYKIMFRFGEKDITLAKGLTENSANVLFDKLTDLLNLQTK
ncbi:hypothetical protein [Roseivirga pacifica]|uniref:hypothetical protein n=1 Tax=Roseivirga pacifica TaxID=1267423 RepID=UPI003BAABCE7